MAIPRINGYSLWLMPKGETLQRVQSAIDSMIEALSGTPFEPHVTLIGQVGGKQDEVVSLTQELAMSLSPFKITLDGIDTGNQYFQCVFLKAERTQQVMAANAEARKVFNQKQDSQFNPHLSLVYGHYPDAVKEDIVRSMGGTLTPCSFHVESLHLFSTFGAPENWYRVKEFGIGGRE